MTYCFVVIALSYGVISVCMFKSEPVIPVTYSHENQQSSQEQHPSFFTSGSLFLSVGINNEQLRLSHSMQNVSYRIYPSLLNAFRTNHSTQLVDQKIFTGNAVFILNSAKKQMDGYYLYHLRKLLI
jgi:phenylalanyl-tRNA synthetase beta subunit